jgi:hypothetical protein
MLSCKQIRAGLRPKLSVVHKLPKNDSAKKFSSVPLYVILGACYVITVFVVGVCLLKLLYRLLSQEGNASVRCK